MPPIDFIHSGWVEKVDPASGRPYYMNPATGQTVWERPAGTTAPAAPGSGPAPVTYPSPAPAPAASGALPAGWNDPGLSDQDVNDFASLVVAAPQMMSRMGELMGQLSNLPIALSQLQQGLTMDHAKIQSMTTEALKNMSDELLKSVMPATKADGKRYLLSESQIAETYSGKVATGWPRPSDPINPFGQLSHRYFHCCNW
jgi:hypothetical protein